MYTSAKADSCDCDVKALFTLSVNYNVFVSGTFDLLTFQRYVRTEPYYCNEPFLHVHKNVDIRRYT